MTQRERILAIVVVGLLGCAAVYWMFDKYRSAVQTRMNKITALEDTRDQLVEQQMQGAYADRQMGEYMIRSLSSNTERASSDYSRWLRDMAEKSNLQKAEFGKPTNTPIGDLYVKHGFRVKGEGDAVTVIDLLYSFYAEDYLHRLRQLDLKPNKEGAFDIVMLIDAVSLSAAPVDANEPGTQSWRVDDDVATYREKILNRNLFEPPNQAPRFTGKPTVEAYVGKTTPITLTFQDPEQHRVEYSLISSPSNLVSLDERSGTLQVKSDEKQSIEVELLATDFGYPRRSVKQKLTINVIDQPPPPPVTPEKPNFDDASQTVLTGLVQGSDDWTAWMNVRTRGKTIKLQVGDAFEIGTVKGKVTNITAKYVELEMGDRRFTLNLNKSLGEAARKAQED